MSRDADSDDLFWDSDGLRRVSELIRSQIGKGKPYTQTQLALLAGVSTGNLSTLLKNRHNRFGSYVQKPTPDTLLRLAPHIIDPDTGKAFDPAKFLAIAWKLNDRVIVLSTTDAVAAPALPPHLVKARAAIEAVLEAEKIDLKTLAESMKLDTAGITQPEVWLQSLLAGNDIVDPDTLHCLANRIPLDGIKSNIEVWAKLFNLDLKAIAAQHEQSKQGNGHSKAVKKVTHPKPKA